MNLEKTKKRKKITDEDDDQSLDDGGILSNSATSPTRRSKLTTVNSSDGSENQPKHKSQWSPQFFPRWYELSRNLREKPYVYWD